MSTRTCFSEAIPNLSMEETGRDVNMYQPEIGPRRRKRSAIEKVLLAGSGPKRRLPIRTSAGPGARVLSGRTARSIRFAYDGGMRFQRPKDLAMVVDLARKVLADLDPGDVPAPLATVAAKTGRSLVPPLQRRLIDEIDRNEWLRERIAERCEKAAHTDDRLETAAVLFLRRPDGWEADLAELAFLAEQAEQSDRIATMARRIEDLEAELDAWRNRARRNRRMAEEAAARADRRVATARAEASDGRFSMRAKALERENRALRENLEAARAEQWAIGERLAETREELRRERRTERSAEPVPAPSAWASLDVFGSARLLDDMVEAFLPAYTFDEARRDVGEKPLDLPKGTPPDDRSAIEWLLTLDRDFALLVDGYNVAYHLDRARFNSSYVRQRLETDLARLKELAHGRPRVTLVYDSRQSGGITRTSGPSGIEIRFTSVGHSADDELLALAADLGPAAVVVTTDRQVREAAQAAGSLGLWSEALAGWIRNA